MSRLFISPYQRVFPGPYYSARVLVHVMGIKDELSASDRELSMFPVRAFEFVNAGTIVIEQVRLATSTVYAAHVCVGIPLSWTPVYSFR